MAGQSGAGLEVYNEKRDFSQTAEPRGQKAKKAGHAFVIQKHAATRLHYDLRLEMDGVLKSWAVAKGPSLVAGEKRLAVHVEDHPLDYGDFEGTIPKGNYGAGAVIVWDRGDWSPVDDAARGYAKGHLEFELKGEKLSGRWHLVRMRGKRGETRENWLLIKSEDAAARPDDAPDILTERPESVKTGRTVEDVAEGAGDKSKPAKPKQARRSRAKDPKAPATGAKKAPMPDFIEPALATLKPAPPAGARWLHEVKFDGYRLQARLEGQEVRLLTRSGLDWTDRFGSEITDALRALPAESAIMDGELVVESGAGSSDFSALQADLSEGRNDRFVLYVFDLMYLNGYDLRDAPLIARKGALEDLVGMEPGRVRFSSHFGESGSMVLRHACRLSLEGIISKEADAPYRSGRGKGWIKSKCSARQEFVVAGYVPSTSSDKLVGSLVLGVHEGGKLTHVGRVGTGFSQKIAEELRTRLDGMRIDKSPFAGKLTADEGRGVRFVRPELVAEVEFRAWTADRLLRHASFRGLREDKPASEVVRESGPAKKTPNAPKRRVALTHPDRIYWPDEGITKEGLADYYAEVWPKIAPFVVGRPLALLRCPGGINGQRFFQKHAWNGINKHIALVKDPKEKAEEAMIAINDLDGLMALVQSAALEIHPWGSTVADWERPDTITMDLDPGEGVAWDAVIAGAQEVRQRLADAGLATFVKTSGGKGLHVVAPLTPKADWPAVKAFTKGLADAMAADAPEAYVSTITKSKRKGRILIDYLRNQRGMTAVAAYSTRARPGATVSMPVAWEELDQVGPGYFTVENTPNRLAALARDPWEDLRAAARPLEVKAPKRQKG
ncbi:DNA ligase D [Paracoccus benzoatiresistens]|uniref:DNA ligase (ATP) n=1 Tax=Paracoccus benzoatiresistens TaxID=2997341 RepID=A0ABT4J1K0_9RHOB|nr:DNA ligase D [Paracoccus sp. EF6]MCZ0960989.1 DNA ligase D [Paracoccus sp. EF6]